MSSYWERKPISRRNALRGAAAGGVGVAALSLVGCGGGSSSSKEAPKQGSEALDSTKGKPGGTLLAVAAAYPSNVDLTASKVNAAARMAGLTHSGLLSYRNGRPGVDGTDISSEPDVAQALPEQAPDQLTYTFKIRPGVKFHNGRILTSEDVKYTFDRYAFFDRSAFKDTYPWLDKTEAPDPQTFVVKTKYPFADTIQSLTALADGFLLAKEYQEGPDAVKKQMGTGPYLWGEDLAPVSTSFKKNPDYFNKPYPYFDEVKLLITTDDSKKVADFSARAVHVTWWNPAEPRDLIRKSRPDAQLFEYPASGFGITPRVDQAPFTDKRVRQALSMTIDRKAVRDGVSKGEGEDDQVLSLINKAWGFRRPKELKSAKVWNYDPTEAKKLLTAAGLDKPLDAPWTHWDASVNGQATVDMAVLIQAKWRELGVANIKDITVTSPQFMSTVNVGQFDGLAHGPNAQPVVYGLTFRNVYWSPPEGVKAPSTNLGHVNNQELSGLLDKQLRQFNLQERKNSFKEIEEIMGEEQYRIILSTYTQSWFADPSVKNALIPIWGYSGAAYYYRYWWFDKA